MSIELVKHVTSWIQVPKPILKWVGGKTQILEKVLMEFPIEINNYRESFLGGGSVLFALLTFVNAGIIRIHGNIYAYDINEPLIYVYINIQRDYQAVYHEMQKYLNEFNACGEGQINRTPSTLEEAMIAKENYYYWIRSAYNKLTAEQKTSIVGSAMFIFLNKTCFRGVFRLGPHGFNVPFGHYLKPEIINLNHLEAIHRLIQPVIFECSDFTVSLSRVETNDFVYLDPPYAPETETSFVGYTENGFYIDHHKALFGWVHELTRSEKKVLFSNADVKLIRDNFADIPYTVIPLLCKRTINSRNPEIKAKEVLIKNY